jgi:hypothetical protein
MMKKLLGTALFVLVSLQAQAASLPADWAKWTAVKTPLIEAGGALPGCDANVSSLPTIYQETVKTYCGVKPGGPGKVQILVRPEVMKAYTSRDGKFPDGANMILHLKDIKAIFLTTHIGGKPSYSVHTEDGADVTAGSGPLAAGTCVTCHTGYQAFCQNGQCGSKK